MLLRTLMAWLRDEPRVCSMVPIPDEADEEARRAGHQLQGRNIPLSSFPSRRSWWVVPKSN
jgi:hypothetical protein